MDVREEGSLLGLTPLSDLSEAARLVEIRDFSREECTTRLASF